MGTLIRIIFYQPMFNILILLYDLLSGDLGLAIILVAALAKLVTIPITRKQLKSAEEMKVFQEKSQKIKEKYNKNTEKMNEELMKLSSKYMPAQLGGCLPLIVSIILLIQVRGVVIDLVNKGYHSFNEVAYVEAFKKDEDSVYYTPKENLETGEHEFKILVEATDGHKLEKAYKFEIVDDREKRLEEIEAIEKDKSVSTREEESKALAEQLQAERDTDISIFNLAFDDKKTESKETIVLERSFLIFPSEMATVYMFEEEKPEFEIYLRAPSHELLSSVQVSLDGIDVTEEAEINKGEKLNLHFFGIDLSKVGKEYVGDWMRFAPYLIIALLLAFTQFVVSKIQMGVGSLNKKKEESSKKLDAKKKKKKKEESDEPDFSEMMQQSSKQMIYFMPVFSMLMSLGYIGGASIFPAAVSVFWTAQNGFVIIQLGITKREEIKELLDDKFNKDKKTKLKPKKKELEIEEAEIIEDTTEKKKVSSDKKTKKKSKNKGGKKGKRKKKKKK